jgi:hypothetical protein
MTTYNRDVRVGNKNQQQQTTYKEPSRGLGIDATKGGSLAKPQQQPSSGNGSSGNSQSSNRSPKGNWGSDSWNRSGNTTRTALDVTAKPVGKSERTTSDRVRVGASNAARGLGNAAKGVGKGVGRATPGVGINAKGDVEVGLRVGGAGIAISVKGDVSLGVPGLSVVINPKNLSNTTVDLGYGTATVEQIREGCTITVNVKMFGKIVNSDTRQADDCVEPDPTPEPTPTPTPEPTPKPADPSPSNPPKPPSSFRSSTIRPLNLGDGFYEIEVTVIDTYNDDAATGWLLYNYPSRITASDNVIERKIKYPFYTGWIGGTVGFYVRDGDFIREDFGKQNFSFCMKSQYFPDGVTPVYVLLIAVSEGEGTGYTIISKNDPNNQFGLPSRASKGSESVRLYEQVITEDQRYDPNFPDSGFLINCPFGNIHDIGNLNGSRKTEITHKFIPEGLSPQREWPYSTPSRIIPKIMPEQCDCELLEDIYDMLGGEDFFKDGLEIPNHLFIPGGTGETKALTYNALLNLMFRTLDHRTVGEVEVSIKDNNIMKEGDQGLTMKLVNATAATGKILELSQKQDSDLTAVLNLLMRLSWISVQILKVVNIGSEATKTIVSFFAIPVKEKVINVDIPVDPSLGGKIGFDPKKPSEDQLIKILDLDDPQKTISIFDKFMNNSKIPVKVKQFIGDRSGGNYWWLIDKNKK